MPRLKQPRNVSRAKALRSRLSLPEVLLWQQLRQQSEIKFRRQHPIGPYVIDFYCARSRLCVEVDGIAHDMGNRPQRDAHRDAWLREQGIQVFRIAAAEILKSPEDVAESLVRHCSADCPSVSR